MAGEQAHASQLLPRPPIRTRVHSSVGNAHKGTLWGTSERRAGPERPLPCATPSRSQRASSTKSTERHGLPSCQNRRQMWSPRVLSTPCITTPDPQEGSTLPPTKRRQPRGMLSVKRGLPSPAFHASVPCTSKRSQVTHALSAWQPNIARYETTPTAVTQGTTATSVHRSPAFDGATLSRIRCTRYHSGGRQPLGLNKTLGFCICPTPALV